MLINWPKLQMGRRITWIGWEINFAAGGFRLPADKRDKAISLLESCFSGRRVSKKHLDKVLGLMQWILQCAPELRPWLCCLYDDVRRPLGASYSVDPSDWPCLGALEHSTGNRYSSRFHLALCQTQVLALQGRFASGLPAGFGFALQILLLPGASFLSPAKKCFASCSGGAGTPGLGVRWPCHQCCPSIVQLMPLVKATRAA